jgi:hypothetical protein
VYSASLRDMTVHSHTSSFTLSATRVYPADLAARAGENGFDVRTFYSAHESNPTEVWSEHPERIHLPSVMHFTNQSVCGEKPLTIVTAIYQGYGKLAPVRRNPT